MGGKLLNGTGERFNRQKFTIIHDKVLTVLNECFEMVRSPPALPLKETWGDVDFQVYGSNTLPNPSFLFNHSSILSKQVVITNPESGMSFECDGVQIDVKLYHCKMEYENDYILMAMGGIGNMLGYAFKAIGLKWNLHGLFYIAEINDMNKTFLLMRDSAEITRFIGLDFSMLCSHKTDDQVFKQLCSIPFLSYDVVYQRMKYISEKDTKIRPSVMKFINYYLQLYSDRKLVPYKHFDLYLESKFPTVMQDVKEQISASIRLKIVKSKFNGSVVSQVLSRVSCGSFEGIKLGNFTSRFRNSFDSLIDFQDFVVSNSQDRIQEAIIEFYKKNNF